MKVKKKKKSNKKKDKKISYHRKPEKLSMDEWQIALREQYGKDSKFSIKNLGEHPLYSDFLVANPKTGSEYKVALRSGGMHFCSCLDFKTNRLGTCKHLGFAKAKLLRKRGNKKLSREAHQQRHSSIYIDYSQDRKVKLSIGSDNAKKYQKLAGEFFDVDAVLTRNGFMKFEKVLEAAREIDAGFRCYEDALEFVIQERDRIKRHRKIARLFKDGLNSKTFDKLVSLKLYDYQKQGVLFAIKAGRCLIADDMGLGKTVQAIASAEFFKRYYKISRTIIVCPTSLKYQWKHEIERLTSSKAMVMEGNVLTRNQLYKNSTCFYHILGYRMAANDLKSLNDMEPDLVILDEAQRIKNWKTKTSAAIKKLRAQYRLVLTGTPIENKLEELYSIMQFIDQFRLDPLYRFLQRYQVQEPDSGKVVGYQNLKEIGERLKDVLIRRTKRKVLSQMPKRQDKVLLVPMTEEQMIAHDEFRERVARLVFKWRRMKFLNEKDRKRLLLSLAQMRMVCNSTYIIDQETRYDTKVMELMSILEEFMHDPDEKVVIFSQWVRMHDIVAGELDARGINYQYLHGGVPSKKREKLLDTFRDDPKCRVFLSTDAGGVGLNLQVASLVVNLDIPWNPAVLEQRIARVYRLGQNRSVQVINLVSANTIEHKMLDVLKFKSSVAKGVLDDGEDSIFLSDSKFNKLMDQVEDLTRQEQASPHGASFTDIQEELAEQNATTDQEPEVGAFGIDSDKQDEEGKPDSRSPIPDKETQRQNKQEAEQMVQNGLAFFQSMMQTLKSAEKTETLVKTITTKDEQTGQTYLKIPVENEAFVSNALQLLGQLFSGRK